MAFVVVCKPELASLPELRPMTLRDGPEKWERTYFVFHSFAEERWPKKNLVERSNLFAKTVFSRSN